jgi:hypothetical protein
MPPPFAAGADLALTGGGAEVAAGAGPREPKTCLPRPRIEKGGDV